MAKTLVFTVGVLDASMAIGEKRYTDGDIVDPEDVNLDYLLEAGFIKEIDDSESNAAPETKTSSGNIAVGVGGFGGFNRSIETPASIVHDDEIVSETFPNC